MRNSISSLLFISCLICMVAGAVQATDLIGTVTDIDTGSPIANILVKNIDANDSTYTDINGIYIFTNLSPGLYTLIIGGTGYSTSIRRSVSVGSCCIGDRGNVDGDPNDVLDISDLLYLVDYMFAVPNGPAPICPEEADVNASGALDISDLLFLVDYMFASSNAIPPSACN